MKNEEKELWRIAYTDELTELYNRRYLKLNIRGTIQSLSARNEPLCLLVLDIDKFKGVNDTYGHLAGDVALKAFASILKKLSGKHAISIRYAGDEFCVVIPRYDKRTGKVFSEKLIKLLEQTSISISKDQKIKISTSIGVASLPKDASTYEDLFKRADEALYKAKALGRAQFYVYPDDELMIAPDLINSLFPVKELIGREKETKILLDYLNGKSKMVPVISGSPGMGKTFLMKWVEDKARQSSMQVISVSGHAFWSFQPLSALFSSIALFRENNAGFFNSILESITGEQKETLLVHLNIKNAKQEKSFAPELILESISSFFIHVFEKGKTALILDDIQKIDEDSIRFLDSFLEQFKGKSIYPFIVIERLQDDLTSVLGCINLMPYLENNLQFIELEPMSETECDRFVSSAFTHNPFPESFRKVIYSNTNGKPLFIQELLKNLLSSQKIIYSIDQWQLSNCSESDLTISLEHIAKNRIKLFDAELQDVLSKAALIGDSFDLFLLSKISGIDENRLDELLREGETNHIIVEGVGQEGDFSFINPHEKQALVNLIDKEDQKKIFEKIVEFENTVHDGNPKLIIGRLMYHLNKGFLFRRAFDLLRKIPTSVIGSQVSADTLASLQKGSLTKIEEKEEALSQKDIHKSLSTIKNIKIAIHNLQLYPKANKNVRRSIEKVFEDIKYFLSITEAYSISFSPEMILFNGTEPSASQLGNLPSAIYPVFNNIGLKGITFIRGLKFNELMNFLELPSKIKGEPKDQWESLLKENNIKHILPDRKFYVAVGEKEIALDGDKKIILNNKHEQKQKPKPKSEISDELLEQYQVMIDKLKAEAKNLINNLDESSVPTKILLKLTRLLEDSSHPGENLSAEKGGRAEQENRKQDKDPFSTRVKKADFKNVQPDYDTLELSENDTKNLLLDLSSDNVDQQAFAIARLRLLTKDIARIVFNYLSSENDPKSNRLAAQIVKKIGIKPSNDFLSCINPGLDDEKLIAFLQLADVFYERDLLYKKLEELLLQGNNQIVRKIEKIILNAPLKKRKKLLLDFMAIAPKDAKFRLLKIAVFLKIKGVTPFVNNYLIPMNKWVDQKDNILVEQAILAAGELDAPDEETKRRLLNYLKPNRYFIFGKSVPNNVRSAALMSLGKINPPELKNYLPKLSKDKNQKIAYQAGKILNKI